MKKQTYSDIFLTHPLSKEDNIVVCHTKLLEKEEVDKCIAQIRWWEVK